MGTYKSPLDLDYAYITDVEFHMADAGNSQNRSYTLELGRPDPKPSVTREETENRDALDYRLKVRYKVDDADSGQELAEAFLTVVGRVTADRSFTRNHEAAEIDTWMEANAVTLLYAKAKASFEYLTAMSPIGVQTLPTIDPYAYLSGLDEQEESKEEGRLEEG